MTAGILLANASPSTVRRLPGFKQYLFFGYYYEHKTHTAGFVFAEESLKEKVKKCGKDPILVEGGTPKNCADWFVREFGKKERKLIVLSAKHQWFASRIIRKNYSRFAVYARR